MLRIQGDAQLLRQLLLCANDEVTAAIEKRSQMSPLIENDLQYRQVTCTRGLNRDNRDCVRLPLLARQSDRLEHAPVQTVLLTSPA